MKHSVWLRLRKEGELICRALFDKGYGIVKHKGRISLSWTVEKQYYLTFLPAPVSEWAVLPNDGSEFQKTLVQLVNNFVAENRVKNQGGGR